MKSVLAVLAQIALSASNYAVFIAMARLLDDAGFVAFSTAVGLNLLAYAVAEAGTSYVAPKMLAEARDLRAASLAGAFVAIGTALYVVAMCGGYLAWNALAAEPLSAAWVLAYAAFFVPGLLMPAWITCLSIDRTGVGAVVAVRTAIVVVVCLRPSILALWLGSGAFAVLVAWLLVRGNRAKPVVALPDRSAVRSAFKGLREVFAAKALSYAVYALLPLLVGVLRGNSAAATYITAERLKSLYATLFQPIVQSLYLWQFQQAADQRRRGLVSASLQALNAAVCGAVLLATSLGWLGALGERFAAVPLPHVVFLAGGLSVATACLLHLHVFPSGAFGMFRRASIVAMFAFAGLALWLHVEPSLEPVWLLFGGELALLLAVGGQQVLLSLRRAAQ